MTGHGDELAGCLTNPQAWGETTQAVEQRLAPGIADVSDVPQTAVECDDPATWKSAEAESHDPKYELSGYVRDGEKTMHLAPSVCYALDQILVEEERPDLDCLETLRLRAPACRPSAHAAADALVTVAHEAEHIAGIDGEAKAQCYGLQATPALGASFGFTEEEGRQLARYAMRTIDVPAETDRASA